jgi:hypothetical protein
MRVAAAPLRHGGDAWRAQNVFDARPRSCKDMRPVSTEDTQPLLEPCTATWRLRGKATRV